jgi:hypothetical protein
MLEHFLKVFGKITVADVALVISAIVFLALVYKKVKSYLLDKLKQEETKDAQIQKVLELSEQYPIWHQQSLDIQKRYNNDISELKQGFKDQAKRIEQIEEDRKVRDRNKLADRLLQCYQLYANENKNPMLAWTEMEKDAFDKLFRDYENRDGNGYMHSTVKPAMNALEVIPMHEVERLTQLMHSRK